MNRIKKIEIVKPINERPSFFWRVILQTGGVDGLNWILIPIFYLKQITRNKQRTNYLLIEPENIVLQIDGDKKVFRIEDIKYIKIYYNTELYTMYSDYEKYSKIEFKNADKKYQFFISISRSQMRKIGKYLYENQVNFKEYYNEQRTYMGKKLSYKEIQKFKTKYGIE